MGMVPGGEGECEGGVPMSLICKGYGIKEVLKTR